MKTRIGVFAQGQILCISRMVYRLAIVMPPPPPTPFWMTENEFRSHFSPFQINTQLFIFFPKMAAGGHFRLPKITFDRISRHFRSILNFNFFGILFTIGWPKIPFDRISRHFRSIRNSDFLWFFHKMAAGGHFGWPKITFNRISPHFRSILNFYFFWILFTKWLPAAILDDQKSLLIAFLAISDQYATLIFFTKWLPVAILDDRKSLSIAFLAISDQYSNFFFWGDFVHKMASGHFGWLKIAFDRISRHIWSMRNFDFFFIFFTILQLLFFGGILFTKWPAAILDD